MDNRGQSSVAEAGTLQLEFKYLSELTGNPIYWQKVEKVSLRLSRANRFLRFVVGDARHSESGETRRTRSNLHVVRCATTLSVVESSRCSQNGKWSIYVQRNSTRFKR